MGIPGLARRLEPYSTLYSAQQLEGYSAVIDGPALAYHAHKLALAASHTRVPSYADIITEAIRWLNGLEDMKIKVSTILFDGSLPQSKRAERLSRLEQNNKRVQHLRASYPTTACPIPTYLGSNSYAFLAPALREALNNSSFASRTHIVPGEADDWCALHAKNNARSIILTSDTDLVLYNYKPETLIVFLQDADISAGIKAFSPEHIWQKLQLKSLLPFAFAISQGSSDTTNDLISKAQNTDVESREYLDFSIRYTADAVAPTYPSMTTGSSPAPPDPDVRVSEFVHQVLHGSSTPLVYLPLLVEDPNQASAWTMGQDVRTLAYSLLAPQNAVVHEYKRKAQGIFVHEVSTYSTTEVRALATQLDQQFSILMNWASSKAVEAQLLWPLFALSLVLADMNTPPSVNSVLRILNGDFDNTWAFIHLLARIQAMLYSLRIVKQITNTCLAVNEITDAELQASLSNLDKHMANFPAIAEMFTVSGQKADVLAAHAELKELVEEIYASAGVEVPKENVSNKKKKKQARENERKKKKTEQRQQPRPQVSNTFTLLKTE
ncbi:XPG domain containing-domain-containing protein [Pyrenochaeta sp. MPI-SDFR-AT-0127]|nr:XPG domain containing-domain-containing protein [Pyrenochaeta sp. MPI-SDFR-AT-0127]